jgi:predicted Zn-dependent peptidase
LANQADQLVSGLAAPGTRGEWELRRLVFASSERSSLPAIGTTTSLMSLSQEAVATFYNSHAGSASSTLVVVGDLSSTNVLATVEQAFGSWIGRSGGRRSLAAPRAAARSSQTLVNRPGAAQTQVNLGVLAPGSGDADWAALTVACHVLGGGTVTSRLMSSLREDKGFTYGVFAQMAPEGARSLFKVSGSFATPVTGAAVAELLRVVAHAVDEGLTVEEVHGAASYLSGVFPLSMQTTQSVAHHVLKLLASDLPVDWTDKHLNALAAVDAEAASDALRRHIRPDAMSLAFVGDADAIAGDLAGAGIQPTSVQS